VPYASDPTDARAGARLLAGRAGRPNPQPAPPVTAQVYARDGFTCRYCRRRTIPTQLLRLISTAFPVEFPFHPNWAMATTPRAYWDISTSLDHVQAVSTGGDWQALANLVTACARCQYQKSNLPLSALGWTIRDSDRTWDGLISSYDALWNLAGHVQRRVAELGLLPFTP
jgi:5-methylcytosine-specific restriction endonuclease McrA